MVASCESPVANHLQMGQPIHLKSAANPSHINGLIWGFYFGTPEWHLSPNLLFTLFWSYQSDTHNLKVHLV